MRIVFIRALVFSASVLRELISIEPYIVGVCTLKTSSFNADHEDLTPIAQVADFPGCPATEPNSLEALDCINSKTPDPIFCFGLSRLIRQPLHELCNG